MPVLEHNHLEETLADLKHQQQELLAEVKKKKGRDFWEKIQLVSPLLSAILISSTGLICTYNYNQQQIKLQEIQTIEKFIPHLLGNEVSKKAAILALSSMGHTELATKFAKLFASEGTVSALQTMAKDSAPEQKEQVNKALAAALDSMADKYRADKQDVQAEEAYRKALSVRDSAFAPNDADLSYSLEKLSDLYMTHGEYNQAEPLLKRSLAIREKLYGGDDPLVAESLKNLAQVYRLTARNQEADALSKRADAIDRTIAANTQGKANSTQAPSAETAGNQAATDSSDTASTNNDADSLHASMQSISPASNNKDQK